KRVSLRQSRLCRRLTMRRRGAARIRSSRFTETSRLTNLSPRQPRLPKGHRALAIAAHTGRRAATPELSQAMSVTAVDVAVASYCLCYSDQFCVASFDQGKVGYERTTILCADRGRRA